MRAHSFRRPRAAARWRARRPRWGPRGAEYANRARRRRHKNDSNDPGTREGGGRRRVATRRERFFSATAVESRGSRPPRAPTSGRSAPHTRAHGIARDRTRARASPERRATNDARRFSSLDGVDRVERASTATRRRRPTRREASIADSFAKGDESESRRARASSARARRGRARWRR